MPLTEDQKKLVTGGAIGASALLVGYLLFRSPKAHGGSFLPGGGDEHAHHKKHRHSEEDGEEHENQRGEYGHKKHKHHHHSGTPVVGRPQQLIFPTVPKEEGPGAPIWRLNERINAFVFDFGPKMAANEKLWAKIYPTWEGEVLPFLGEWEAFWRDSSQWSWSTFNQWATRWNALNARLSALMEHARG